MRVLLLLGSVLLTNLSFAAQVGETAEYKLSRSRSRTSSIVSDGSFKAKIESQSEDKTYQLGYQYFIDIRFAGEQRDSGSAHLPEKFFNGEFLQELKKKKTISTPQFKAQYLGSETVRLDRQRIFRNADKIKLWDLNLEQLPFDAKMHAIFSSFLNDHQLLPSDIELEDVEIIAHLHHDIEVVGAVKVDISGKINGFRFRIGFDHHR